MPIEYAGYANVAYTSIEVEKLDTLITQRNEMLDALKKAKFLMDEEPEEGHNIAYIVIANAIARVEGGLIRPITEGDNDDKV